MTELLLHPATSADLKGYLDAPAPALLITGVAGAGKLAVAKKAAAALLGVTPESLDTQPGYIFITPIAPKREIGIDQVRQVIKQLSLKSTGSRHINRVVVIGEAHLMSLEAQSALLKVLEEPPADTVFILTSPAYNQLLPTVVSRCQIFAIRSTTDRQAERFYGQQAPKEVISRAWALSGGAAGLLASLIQKGESHPLKKAVADAKAILTSPTFERLHILEQAASDKESFEQLLDGLTRVLAALHSTSLSGGRGGDSLLKNRRLVHEARSALQVNANPRLVALHLALNLKTSS